MIHIARILLPVDLSIRCFGMLSYVKAIAQLYRSEIILLHVVNPVYAIPEPGGWAPALIPVPQWVFTSKGKELAEFAVIELQHFPVRRLLFEGDPESQIAATVDAE